MIFCADCEGRSEGGLRANAEIAEALVITKRTAETHITNILSKLGFSSRGQISAWAIKKGVISPSD